MQAPPLARQAPDRWQAILVRNFLDRFVKACQADERVVAAFLGGSYGQDAADAFSALDLYLVTAADA